MKKIDIILSLVAGEAVSWLFVFLLKNSNFSGTAVIWSLPIVFPILSLFCLWIAYLIGKKFLFVFQLAKFILIGAIFAMLDLLVFNVLMQWFGITDTGWKYKIFVGISFIIATCVKFLADKYWAFEKKEGDRAGFEFGAFFVITLISGVIQVAVASLVAGSEPMFGTNALAWANVGKISGIVVASAWNFLGYKFFVFKK